MKQLEPESRLPVLAVEREIVQPKPFSILDLGDVLKRRKLTLVVTFAVVAAIGLGIIATTKPLYQAKTRLLIEGRTNSVAYSNTDNPLSGLFVPAPNAEVDTQVEVLQSAGLLEKVGREIEVDPKAVKVDVRQLGKTDLVELIVTSNSASDAEKFAAALPATYLRDLNRGRTGEVSKGLNFARRRLAEKTAELEKAEQALRNFKSQAGVVNPAEERAQDITANATAQANARQAIAAASSARASLEALQASRRRLPSTISTPVTTTNPEVAVLKDRIAALREERARLLFLYKPGHDEVRKVDVNIAALDRRLASTPTTITTVTRSPNPALAELDAKIADNQAQYRAAQANWNSAAASATRLRSTLPRYNAIEMQQAQLQRAIDQGRNSVDVLSRSVEEMSLREKAAIAANAPVKVVASSPAEKIAPRIARSLIVILLMGTLLGCAMAFVRDAMDEHIQSEGEMRSLSGQPVLGYLPSAPKQGFLLAPDSSPALLERYRLLRAGVLFALSKRPDRTVQVTSTMAGEGKTQTAANLAMVTAHDNWRVILVDANLRQPRLHEVFHLSASPGLTDVLMGSSTLEGALQSTNTPNLRVLTAGIASPHAMNLLDSPAMDALLGELNASADLILLDSPAYPSSADARVLSSKVDGVLYVAEQGRVTRSGLQQSLELLQRANAFVLGLALNNAASGAAPEYSPAVHTNWTPALSSGGLGAGEAGRRAAADPFARQAASNDAPAKALPVGKIGLLLGVVFVAVLGFQALRARSLPPLQGAQAGANAADAQGTPINVADAVGEVEVWQPSGRTGGNWRPISVGSSLTPISGIRTGTESALLLQLGEAGVLRVGANTKLKIRRVSAREYSVRVDVGKVWGRVLATTSSGQGAPLKVRTPSALVSSRNGLFSVASGYGGALTMVSTQDGSATVRHGSREMKVEAGRAVRVQAGAPSHLKLGQQAKSAVQMWNTLLEQESWTAPDGGLQLDHSTVFQLQTVATR